MSLRDGDNSYKEADVSENNATNTMPDGRYTLRIVGVTVRELPKNPDVDILSFSMIVDEPKSQYHGCMAQASYMFGPDEQKNKNTARGLKYLTNACGLGDSCPPSAFGSAARRNMFIGYVLSAAKSTNESGGKTYTNWNYWNLISKPTLSGAAPTPPPETDIDKQIDEEIDLSEEPF